MHAGIVQLSHFFEDADVAHVDVALIKIDDNDYLRAAKRLATTEECEMGRRQMLPRRYLNLFVLLFKGICRRIDCEPGGYRRVLLDLDAKDVHKFLLAVS